MPEKALNASLEPEEFMVWQVLISSSKVIALVLAGDIPVEVGKLPLANPAHSHLSIMPVQELARKSRTKAVVHGIKFAYKSIL